MGGGGVHLAGAGLPVPISSAAFAKNAAISLLFCSSVPELANPLYGLGYVSIMAMASMKSSYV
jgi:hypothetical protein